MSLKIYQYAKCSTCRKALQFLEAHSIKHTTIPIREQPPSKAELKLMLEAYDGEIKKLFNTSGMDYRALGIKDKLPSMSNAQAIELLSGNGNLIKRPFVVSKSRMLIGFKDDVWSQAFEV